MNQSDHYWSFQVANNNCRCPQDDYSRQLQSRRYLSGSLQRLDRIDCASITHDIETRRQNWQPRPSNDEPCPLHLCTDHAATGSEMVEPSLARLERRSILKPSRSEFSKYPFPLNNLKVKLTEDLPKYCPRYKNTLTNIPLKPCMKIKFSSQPTLLADKKRQLQVKKNFPSSEEIQSNIEVVQNAPSAEESQSKHTNEVKKIFEHQQTKSNLTRKNEPQTKSTETLPSTVAPSRRMSIATIEDSARISKFNFPRREIYTPISRTTRRMLNPEKKVPFVTFGCNNNNKDVGSKRTHNVFAAEHEVFPNALSAKQQRQDMILRFLKTEKELQKSLLPDNFKKVRLRKKTILACALSKFISAT